MTLRNYGVDKVVYLQWGGGNIVGLGWSSSENVVCVLEEGNMVVYNIYGQHLYARILARVSLPAIGTFIYSTLCT